MTTETAATPDTEQLLYMFRTMVTIREFEEAAGRLAEQAKIPGAVHLYAGEEAVAVGVCAHLRETDTIASTHRGHGHCIAKGGDVKSMFAELFGRASGYCGGKGGSMHIADLDIGILGANGIVGGGPPITVGAAFAAQYRGNDGVSVCFSGDGSTNEGTWHEALNFAAVMKLPAVFVIENNHYGEFTSQEKQGAVTQLSKRAAAYGIPGVTVDGQNVLEVHQAAGQAIDRARRGEGPSIVEADTYRYYNHTGRSEGDPRPEQERARWRERDPIAILAAVLEQQAILSGEGAERVTEEVRATVEEAIAFADAAPYPDPSVLLEDVYTVTGGAR
jgi:pyruvate dehydrogenase E1 component alpha subunit